MVSFEVAFSNAAISDPKPSIRETAIWYPTIPDPELCLNESSYVAENPCSVYRPLIWLHFGGPKGSLLKYITGFSFDAIDCGLCALRFHYNAENAFTYSHWLGRHVTLTDVRKRLKFAIDGAKGERIIEVA